MTSFWNRLRPLMSDQVEEEEEEDEEGWTLEESGINQQEHEAGFKVSAASPVTYVGKIRPYMVFEPHTDRPIVDQDPLLIINQYLAVCNVKKQNKYTPDFHIYV